MRSTLRWLHRVFGLAGAVWLFLVGLTGTLLVFYSELDHAFNPELFRPAGSSASVSVDEAVRAVEDSAAGRSVTAFWRGRHDSDIWTFRVEPTAPEESLEIYLDPTTGRVTGERVWNALVVDRPHLMPLVYQLHYTLLLGAPGEWFVGLVGFLWLLDHFVALILSFPSRRTWLQSFRIRFVKGDRFTFDLHRSVGVWLFLIGLVVAATGTYMSWRTYGEAVVGVFSERTPWPGSAEPTLDTPLVRPALTMQQAIAASGAQRAQGASYDASRGLYVVSVFDDRDLTPDYGQLMIVIDATTGAMRSKTHIAHGSAADVIDAWLLPLHNGKVAGWPGRIAIALMGVALCSFVVTGLMIWARRRTVRQLRATV